ncbi:MAG TPA: nuclear transport factor 2 family protein [Vicinamibacterales bacterium]|jgi:hypothetical protein|nr:nuclear transport factor 2 family protein [Vicinamibacterales bacterium]
MAGFGLRASGFRHGRLLAAALLLFVATGSLRGEGDTSRIDRLETGVRAAEAVRAVKRLQNTYSHYLDAGLSADLGDLFTATATGQFGGEGVTGRLNLEKRLMAEAGRTAPGLSEGQLNAHIVLQPIITLGADGRSAKGAWHEVALLGSFGAAASWRGGIYENEYVLENGVWKISRVQFFEQYRGSYDEYGHKAPATWEVPYHFDSMHVGVTIPKSALDATWPASKIAPAARLAGLAQRVQRLQDETAVQNLQHSYGYYMDRKLWDDVADLFADDGWWEVGHQGVYAGRAHIRQALEAYYGAPALRQGELFDHILMAPVVTVAPDGRTASARSTQLSQIGLNGEFARWELGTYENEFVKQGEVWKVKAVRYFPRLSTDYDLGWAKDAKPSPSPKAGLPPDRASTQTFESYPKTRYVALHYANPVTGRAVRYPAGPVSKIPMVSPAFAHAAHTTAMADVEKALHAIIAVDAVENLNSSYGYYIDESAWDNMSDTFSITAGAKELTGAGTYVGRERIRQALNLRGPRGGRTPTFFTIHQLTQPVVHIAEDGQSAKGRFRLFQGGGNADGSSGSWIGGIYENTAVFEDGEWKFGIQDLHHLFNASYRNGWARVGAAAVRGGGITQGLGGAASPRSFASQMPPDRPIRARQYAFPEITEPAFHYKNPVSGRMPKELLP